MFRTYRVIRDNWSKNHRYHGGLRAVGRCLAGTLALRSGVAAARRTGPAAVEVLTFSVVPWMTALWTRLLLHALRDHDAEVLVGDCSGGFGRDHRRWIDSDRLRVVHLLNDHHGEKIDLALARLCRASYVLIADDDVFWLDAAPLVWALGQLEADPQVAAVSLWPRRTVSSVLRQDDIAQPMGSHCLVIRRDLWRRERLSFAVAPPPEGVDWFYDTGDLANRELLRRGYRVVIAPPEIRRHFTALDGVSTWILKLQRHAPEALATALGDIPVRQTKALQAIRFARGLATLLGEFAPSAPVPEIVPPARLAAAEQVVENHMPGPDRAAAGQGVEETLDRVRRRLLALQAAPR